MSTSSTGGDRSHAAGEGAVVADLDATSALQALTAIRAAATGEPLAQDVEEAAQELHLSSPLGIDDARLAVVVQRHCGHVIGLGIAVALQPAVIAMEELAGRFRPDGGARG